jgi:hypothetical protein
MRHFTPEPEIFEFCDVAKKYDLMVTINSLNRLICYKELRKYQIVASSFNDLIKYN